MSWLLQDKGIINHYNKEIHQGTQPIRVLHHMNIFMFQNTHPNFITELTKAFEQHGFSKKLNINFGETNIQSTPYIRCDNKSIYLDETFLSYLWCISHSIYAIYIQTIDYPRINKEVGFTKYKLSQEIENKAYELFDYGRSLIKIYSKWDIDHLPNPERYAAET
ncbi:MAG TPA: hypothetical protein PKI86_09900, partial [Chitinophagales bacterium]|nr:hypothetical protein [Chitinophagales bacterium]